MFERKIVSLPDGDVAAETNVGGLTFRSFALNLVAFSTDVAYMGGDLGKLDTLADPDLHKRGAKFLTKFLNDIFRNFPKKFLHSRKNIPHLSPKISDDLFGFFLVIWYFSIGEAKSV